MANPFSKQVVVRHAMDINNLVKGSPKFPFDTGHLKHTEVSISMTEDGFCLSINKGGTAPYAYWLDKGTRAHNIPRAFGRELPFGTYGNFSGEGKRFRKVGQLKWNEEDAEWYENYGYFHPGSKKHYGWVQEVVFRPVYRYLDDYCKQENRKVGIVKWLDARNLEKKYRKY